MANLKKSFCICTLALSLISGCTNPLESGKIIEKRYEPARAYHQSIIISSKPPMSALQQMFDDEDFIITFVRTFKGVSHSRTVYVSKEVYDSLKEGDDFDTSKFYFEDHDIDVKQFNTGDK